ncbi:hypothetical protein E1287_23415 [Actinomadura sp. KC06]|uniref:hypothetical protein n=1 Tax=Actinomadura sp. KC06 TaxID=2530369 RepID=UPI00104D0DE2|nr:hypothetical protein [Actinomadura sp. KC06]TDD32257.1 hypothetical protein E1287_23415 [Actinomadura sp. KC06]
MIEERRRRAGIAVAWSAVLLCLVVGSAAAQLAGRSGGDVRPVRAPVVVIGVAGLAWGDIREDQTPHLWRLLTGGAPSGGATGAAAGAATVRTTGGPACASDGWLSLSAGQSSAGPRSDEGECEPLPRIAGDGEARVGRWDELVEAQSRSEFSPHPGELGRALAEHEGCETAIGPGAAVALARPDGTVARYSATVDDAALRCPVTVIDGGQVVESGSGRLNSLAKIDAFAGNVLERLDGGTTVLVQGVTEPPGGTPHLAVSMVAGPATASRKDPALLTVTSTRWGGVVRLLDVPSTLLDAVGAPEPAEFSGAPISLGRARPADPTTTVHELGAVTTTDQTLRRWAGLLLLVVATAQFVLYGTAVITSRRGRTPRPWQKRGFIHAALVFSVLPVSVYLMSLTRWWHAPFQGAALWGALVFTLAVAAVPVWLLPARPLWRVPLAVSLLTFSVLVVDAATGTLLHRASPFGPSALYGGRYYGFGNSTFAVFSVAALVLAGAAAAELIERGRRRAATAAVVLIGVVAAGVDTWPSWGADVGGGLALIPGVAVLAFAVAGVRLTFARLVAVGSAAVFAVAAVAVADWLRPAASRTHAGRFVQDVLEGQAWQLVERKAGYALGSLAGGPLAWGTALVLAVLVVTLAWPGRFSPGYLDAALRAWPTLRPTLAAVLTTCAIGAVVNDYGIRLVTFGLVTLLPLVALTCARAPAARAQAAAEPRSGGGTTTGARTDLSRREPS